MNTTPDAEDRQGVQGCGRQRADLRQGHRARSRPTRTTAKKIAQERQPNTAMGGDLSTELALPRDFEAVAELVREDDLEGLARARQRPGHLARADRRVRAGGLHARLPARRLDEPGRRSSSSRGSSSADGPEPEEIFERTRRGGRAPARAPAPRGRVHRRSPRASTSPPASSAPDALLERSSRISSASDAAQRRGAFGFGVGLRLPRRRPRGAVHRELPRAARRHSHGKDADAGARSRELWTVSPMFEYRSPARRSALILTRAQRPARSAPGVRRADWLQTIHANGALALFLSAIFAGRTDHRDDVVRRGARSRWASA